MLMRKLDTKTLAAVKARADFFFNEQLARLGPIPGLTVQNAGFVAAHVKLHDEMGAHSKPKRRRKQVSHDA